MELGAMKFKAEKLILNVDSLWVRVIFFTGEEAEQFRIHFPPISFCISNEPKCTSILSAVGCTSKGLKWMKPFTVPK